MLLLLCLVLPIGVLLLIVYYLTGVGGRAGIELLGASFANQQATVHGHSVPTSSLQLVHRWRPNAMTSRWGEILAIDANWLCRTPDGLYVLAIGQGGNDGKTRGVALKALKPADIHWIWRSLSEERVRQMLATTPRTYRKVFGSPVPRH